MTAIKKSCWLWVLVWLAAWCAVPNLAAEDLCPVCGNRFGTSIYRYTRTGSNEKLLVCSNCVKLDTTCYICGIPVLNKVMKLADGRLLCDDDAKRVVLTQDEAAAIFEDVKREVQGILSRVGSLPHHNVKVTLEAKARLDKTGANIISTHDDRLLMGLTRSVGTEAGRMEHSVFLLHGLTKERLMAVSAHEYGHAWLHENVHRKLNQDAVEGFCEWIAYKVIEPKKLAVETKALLDSDYSKGQVQAFIAAEKQHGFYRVIQWVKLGLTPEIEAQHLERMLQLREQEATPSEELLKFAAPAPLRPASTNLVLKGLSGTAKRRFAMINDGTFLANEQGKVRLGESNVVLRVLEIRNDSVIVHVTGETAPRTLTLDTDR